MSVTYKGTKIFNLVTYRTHNHNQNSSRPVFICFKSIMKTPEECAKYVQSSQQRHQNDVNPFTEFEQLNNNWVTGLRSPSLVNVRKLYNVIFCRRDVSVGFLTLSFSFI